MTTTQRTSATPNPTETQRLIDDVVALADAGRSRPQAVIDVWETNDVPDVDGFLRGVADRLHLTRGEARRTSAGLRPPWEKALTR